MLGTVALGLRLIGSLLGPEEAGDHERTQVPGWGRADCEDR